MHWCQNDCILQERQLQKALPRGRFSWLEWVTSDLRKQNCWHRSMCTHVGQTWYSLSPPFYPVPSHIPCHPACIGGYLQVCPHVGRLWSLCSCFGSVELHMLPESFLVWQLVKGSLWVADFSFCQLINPIELLNRGSYWSPPCLSFISMKSWISDTFLGLTYLILRKTQFQFLK